MKLILLLIIKTYWFLIPKSKRRCCIFRKTCSQFVFEKTKEHGFNEGWKAFWFRYKNCRYGYVLFKNPIDNTVQMILPQGQIISEEEVSKSIIK
ncbi:membrane protein insertion efficiency factor YidD [uncultured Croceitalea sp.]|uniref:membrane protein insertion efficiency factor YidD n=1 Tax=uncultured Croceitalea sp. TaxID=1798908 RepID=UPI00330577D2